MAKIHSRRWRSGLFLLLLGNFFLVNLPIGAVSDDYLENMERETFPTLDGVSRSTLNSSIMQDWTYKWFEIVTKIDKNDPSTLPFVKKMKNMYDMCMDQEHGAKEELEYIKSLVIQMGAGSLISSDYREEPNYEKRAKLIYSAGYKHDFIVKMYPNRNVNNGPKYVLYVDYLYYYLKLTYKNFQPILDLCQKLGINITGGDIESANDFVKKLLHNRISYEEVLQVNKTTVGELNNKYHFNWTDYIQSATLGMVNVTDDLEISIGAPFVIDDFMYALEFTDPRTVMQYQVLRLLDLYLKKVKNLSFLDTRGRTCLMDLQYQFKAGWYYLFTKAHGDYQFKSLTATLGDALIQRIELTIFGGSGKPVMDAFAIQKMKIINGFLAKFNNTSDSNVDAAVQDYYRKGCLDTDHQFYFGIWRKMERWNHFRSIRVYLGDRSFQLVNPICYRFSLPE